MKHYLSMGFGVNSVALYLLMQDLGMDFEAVFVNHGGDWPETYGYADYFIATGRPVTILKPDVKGYSDIYKYYRDHKWVPSIMKRDCTYKFKLRPFYKYAEKPCFVMIGIDSGESHRARISSNKGCENRYPLIEHEIDRDGCVEIIKNHGLTVPMKSGCYFCMFQKKAQWRDLRRKHPDLFCAVQQLEGVVMAERTRNGLRAFTLLNNGRRIGEMINDKQMVIEGFGEEYPPCQCGL